MGNKTKIALAGAFVGTVAMAAAAFGQTGSGSGTAGANAAAQPAPAARQRPAARCGRTQYRRARRLVHSDAKVKAPAGFAFVTIDQGEITAIDHSAKTITVKRIDGQSVTATATDRTRVCLDGQPSSFDSLKAGDRARLVQVRSERFTGLRRIAAVTPGTESGAKSGARSGAQSGAGLLQPGGSPSDFTGNDVGGLLDGPA